MLERPEGDYFYKLFTGCHDTEHEDTEHNDIQHNDTPHNNKKRDTTY